MDIKGLNDSLTGRSSFFQAGDLLAQLKAAGTIEAEVIKVLQGKLLLSSRLGEILTTNSLNYKTGDRLNLRLSGSEQNPVLKASPNQPEPVTLESSKNPRLSRALPADQPVLAVVTKIAAQRIEIRLAEQILTLPRHVGVSQNQLLHLQRNAANRTIEITPVDRKLIYKALLKQLVPRQSESRSTSLVSLLNLVNKAINVPGPRTGTAADSARQTTPVPVASKQGIAPSRPTIPVLNARTPTLAQSTQESSKMASQLPLVNAKISPSTAKPENAEKQLNLNAKSAVNNRQVDALLAQIKQTGKHSSVSINANRAVDSRPTSPASLAQVVAKSNIRNVALPGSEKISSAAANPGKISPAVAVPANDSQSFEPRPTIPNHQAQTSSQISRTPSVHSPNATPAIVAPTTLQMLLQWVPRLADMNVTQIRQWFEFASLIQVPKAKTTLTVAADPVGALKKLIDQESFSRDLTQTIQLKLKSVDGDDAPTQKTMPQELLQQQVRDGIKLVEQSLSQNLLQRASLGMQQETQQPLSLSLVLPFLEEQEVKPIQIDLSQREQPQEGSDNGWDIRLSLEFADLGPISCHIFLEGLTVAASFYSEQNQTRYRIEQALPELEQQLAGAGFTSCEFHSFPSGLVANKSPTATSYSESLVDIEV